MQTKVVILYSVLFLLLANMLIANLYYTKNIAVGTSMEPTIPDESVVFMQTFSDLDQNLTGKIISYETVTKNTVHRVVADHGDYLITKGDNTDRIDPIVMREQVNYIVDFSLPYFYMFFDIALVWIGIVVAFLIVRSSGEKKNEE